MYICHALFGVGLNYKLLDSHGNCIRNVVILNPNLSARNAIQSDTNACSVWKLLGKNPTHGIGLTAHNIFIPSYLWSAIQITCTKLFFCTFFILKNLSESLKIFRAQAYKTIYNKQLL
jgi:hypothetical protein